MSDIINAAKTLYNLHTQIKFAVTTLDRVYQNREYLNCIKYDSQFYDADTKFQTSINTLISNQCLVLFCSFLDAYEEFNHTRFGKEFEERIKYLRRKNKPGLDRIKQWKGLKDFRNQLVAHNFKIKGKSFFSDEVGFLEYVIPNTTSEKKLFLLITELICLNIRDVFPETLHIKDLNSRMTDKFKIMCQEVDVDIEGRALLNAMRN